MELNANLYSPPLFDYSVGCSDLLSNHFLGNLTLPQISLFAQISKDCYAFTKDYYKYLINNGLAVPIIIRDGCVQSKSFNKTSRYDCHGVICLASKTDIYFHVFISGVDFRMSQIYRFDEMTLKRTAKFEFFQVMKKVQRVVLNKYYFYYGNQDPSLPERANNQLIMTGSCSTLNGTKEKWLRSYDVSGKKFELKYGQLITESYPKRVILDGHGDEVFICGSEGLKMDVLDRVTFFPLNEIDLTSELSELEAENNKNITAVKVQGQNLYIRLDGDLFIWKDAETKETIGKSQGPNSQNYKNDFLVEDGFIYLATDYLKTRLTSVTKWALIPDGDLEFVCDFNYVPNAVVDTENYAEFHVHIDKPAHCNTPILCMCVPHHQVELWDCSTGLLLKDYYNYENEVVLPKLKVRRSHLEGGKLVVTLGTHSGSNKIRFEVTDLRAHQMEAILSKEEPWKIGEKQKSKMEDKGKDKDKDKDKGKDKDKSTVEKSSSFNPFKRKKK